MIDHAGLGSELDCVQWSQAMAFHTSIIMAVLIKACCAELSCGCLPAYCTAAACVV